MALLDLRLLGGLGRYEPGGLVQVPEARSIRCNLVALRRHSKANRKIADVRKPELRLSCQEGRTMLCNVVIDGSKVVWDTLHFPDESALEP